MRFLGRFVSGGDMRHSSETSNKSTSCGIHLSVMQQPQKHAHNLKILWNSYQSTQQWLITMEGGGLSITSYLDYTQLL